MKIGMLTGLWYIAEGAAVVDSLHRAAGLGFHIVDLHGVFHAGPAHLSERDRVVVGETLRGLGLAPRNYILHARHNPASASEAEIDQDVAYLVEGMDMVAEWGVRQIMLNAGHWVFGVPRQVAWTSAVEFLRRVCDAGASRGVVVAQEPEPYVWSLICDLTSACQMMNDVGRPNFAMLIDLGHMGLAREGITDLEPLADRIVHAHFSEHEALRHTNQVLGTGATPTGDLLDALRRLDIDRRVTGLGFEDLVISFELGVPGDVIPDPDDWVRRSLQYVKSIAPDLVLE